MSHLLAIDQGTTSTRSLLFDPSGRLLASAQREFSQSYPQPGWVEHDPQTIWRDVLHTAREVIAKSNAQVAAIGIANQRETTVVWARADGTPIYPAIVWQDRRTAAECERLRRDGAEALVRARTGLLLDPYFSATKLAWILDHVAGARARAERGELAFGTIDSFLLWHLTGGRVHATDATNASRTMLFDIHRQCWDDDLLRLFNIPEALLAEVHDNSFLYGVTAPRTFSIEQFRSRAWRATSMRRWSARPALMLEWRRRPTERAVFSCSTPANRRYPRRKGCLRPWLTGRASGPPTPSRDRSLPLEPRSNGCATGSISSRMSPKPARWRRRSAATMESIWCPPSLASARRIGTLTRGD